MAGIDQVAREMRAKYNDDLWLGHLCWYEVTKVAEITLKEWMASVYGTPVSDIVPKAPRAVDTFKKAIQSTADRRNVRVALNGSDTYTYKFLPRGSGQDAEHVYRSIVVEELDENQHRLVYEPVVKFTYDRASEKILEPEIDREVLEGFPEEVQHLIADKVEQVFRFYREQQEVLGRIKVRELIRSELQDKQRGIPAKESGGIYFVFNDNLGRLDALGDVVNGFAGCSFHSLPVVDDENQREMVRDAYENETSGEADILMKDIHDLLAGKKGGVTMKKAQELHARFSEQTKRLKTFQEHLDVGLDRTSARIDILQQQCMEVFKKVEN